MEDDHFPLDIELKLLKIKLIVLLQSNCLSLVELSSFQLVTFHHSHKNWVRHLAETRHQFVQNCVHLFPALTVGLVRQMWLVEVEIETLRTTHVTTFTRPIWFS